MHRCLLVSEVLGLIFEFFRYGNDQFPMEPQLDKKTLVSLARTCHSFSSLSLDILWRDLDSFGPLLNVLPILASAVDDTQWLTFCKYAKRIRTIRGREERIPLVVQQNLVSSLQHYSATYFPLLPNVTILEWSDLSFAPREHSSISLLRYFTSPAVTTITLSLVRWLAYSSAELAVLMDLPKLCPNVTSFSVSIRLSWDYEPIHEVGQMVTQWPRLQTLRICGIGQSVMDQLFSRRTLETLSLDYRESSPFYVGRIPEEIRVFSLSVDCPKLCTHFFESVYATPAKFCLLLGMNEGKQEAYVEEMFQLLPLRLDTSRLQSLTIQPQSTIMGIPMWNSLEFRTSLISALVSFTALRELDLDFLSTIQMSDADYARMAVSLTDLRSLKLGTADPSIKRPRPMASIGAVITVLRHCQHLEMFHILFDGSIPPKRSTLKDDEVALRFQEQEASNKHITKLCVGYSPITDGNIAVMACCLKSIMPCLLQIEHRGRDQNWKTVQDMLGLC